MKKMDFHVHISDTVPVAESIEAVKALCARNGYTGVGLLALSRSTSGHHPTCNEDALAIRAALPASYAFASLHHEKDFVEQAKDFMARGFDGIKLLEGKPSLYRYYGYGFDHPRYEPFFAYAEQQQIPLVIHHNDPAANWDESKVSDYAKQVGWYYDETMPTKKDFDRVLEQVLANHPALRVSIAHLGFYTDDIDHMAQLLDAYPNLMFDITPAMVILGELSLDPTKGEAFVRQYSDRLIFGTDANSEVNDRFFAYNDERVSVVHTYLTTRDTVECEGNVIHGVSLDEETAEKIYYYNALRFVKKSV